MKIAVLFGGISTERNVSITGGKAVVKALKELGHEVLPIDPAFGADAIERTEAMISDISAFPTLEELAEFSPRNLMNCINSEIFDGVEVAFIVTHGTYGEDGFIQALLELRDIPYTGSDVRASALAIDKLKSKQMFLSKGIITPDWDGISKKEVGDFELYKQVKSHLRRKIVVKPNDQGSTIGISILDNRNEVDFHDAVLLASKYSNDVVVEDFIEGRELTVGIVGDIILPVIEIVPKGGFYDYQSKYVAGNTEYICPADLSEDIAEFTQSMAYAANEALGCSGFSRVDFRLDTDGQPYCLEVNTVPGFTPLSLVPMAAKEIGIEFPQLCEKIIEIAIENYNFKKNKVND